MARLCQAILLFIVLVAQVGTTAIAAELNIYSARHYDTDLSLYEDFTQQTGIEVNLIEGGSDGLIERILAEGELSPADLLVTVDAGRLWRASEVGIFQPVSSEILTSRIPGNLRHPENLWFGLSKRARVIVYRDGEGFEVPGRYEDLANAAYQGRVCMRSSSNIYNLSLMAAMIDALGEDAAIEWARGVVNNFARPPQGNDTAQLRAVASGECGITVANTYYIGRLMSSDKPTDKETVAALKVVFPNQAGRGAHVNISGAGVVRHAPNRDEAVRFLEYLTGGKAQRVFAEGNNEYPIVGDPSGPIAELGNFAEDKVNAVVYGERQAQAVRAFDIAGWR